MKKLFVFVLVSMAALFVNAAAVVWKYTPSVSVDPANSAVKLVAWSGENMIDCQLYFEMEDSRYFAAVDLAEIYSAIPADPVSGISFQAQLYSIEAGKEPSLVEESAKVTYSELYKKNAIFFDAATTPNPTAYDFAGVIPEPTSGLLFLLGFAALSLKRRV